MEEEIQLRHPGVVFQEFRRSKGISQDKACQGVCVRKTLSNFELGKADINASYLMQILFNCSISFAEFGNAVRNYQLDLNERFFSEIKGYNCDKEHLLQMFDEIQQSSSTSRLSEVQKLMLKVFLTNIDPKIKLPEINLRKVNEYFWNVKQWGKVELTLLCNVIAELNINTAFLLVNELLLKFKKILLSEKENKHRLLVMLINIIEKAIRIDCKIEAESYLREVENLLRDDDYCDYLFYEINYEYMQGFYLSRYSDYRQGVSKMKQVLRKIANIGNSTMKTVYQNSYYKDLASIERRLKISC
jgi:Rgg/GadR/MutR family transcriptional activator